MSQHPDPQLKRVRREGREFDVVGSIRVRGRRYDVLEKLGTRHRPRLLLDDPATRQLRVGLVLPTDSATAQHLHVLRRLPQLAELPRIIDFERQREQTTVVLKWIKGMDLGQYLDAVKRKKVVAPSPYEALRLVRGLGHGLLQFHRYAQIMHGDLKPQNLIITRKTSRLVMIDFGSAWTLENARCRAEGDGISQVYAAPEQQVAGSKVDDRADQFAASLILYQLLTGSVAFGGLGGQAGKPGYREEFAESLEPPSAVAESIQLLPKSLRRRIDELLLRSLQLDPDARYPTTGTWLDAITPLVSLLELAKLEPRSSMTPWQRFIDALLPPTTIIQSRNS
jgi:serine/threonine protein kinase